jgi:hypothetical protein
MTKQLLHTSENIVLLEGIARMLESKGLHPELRNTTLHGAIGELAPIDVWPELWISSFEYDFAAELLQEIQNRSASEDWVCLACAESNDASFERCWNCQADR